MSRLIALVMALCAMTALPSFANAHERLSGAARVSDGDTIIVGDVRVRLHGIDAPESGQTCMKREGGTWPCGREASLALAALLEGKEVVCKRQADAKDVYGRMIGICFVDGQNVNEEMVRRGLAWSFKKYSHDYDAVEDEAKERGLGIWQVPNTQPPWDYRHNAWEDALRDAPEGKPIKSTISRKGECIYHTPWSRWYRQIDMKKGGNRQWFATEGDAEKAGCRPPKFVFKPKRTEKRK